MKTLLINGLLTKSVQSLTLFKILGHQITKFMLRALKHIT